MAVKSFRESLKDCFVGDTLIYSVIKAATAFLVCFFLFCFFLCIQGQSGESGKTQTGKTWQIRERKHCWDVSQQSYKAEFLSAIQT